MEFLGPKRGLGMELEYGKFHVELYSHSGIQGGFPTLFGYANRAPPLPHSPKTLFVLSLYGDSLYGRVTN